MGVKGGPDPDETFHPYAVFHFDASNIMGNVSTTSFTNFIKTGSYTDWTIPSANASISGTGASKALITNSYNGNFNSLRGTGTFNQITSYTWSAIFLGGSTTNDNKIVRPNDATNFSIQANGKFLYEGAGILHTSSGSGLTSTIWKHLLFVRSNTSCNLYFNNEVFYTFTLSSNYTSTDSDFRMNSFPGSTATCGYLMYWHNYALTASEIQREYDKLKRRFSLP